ncbi:protein CcmA, bactofilin family [Pustulibacterium marinum]|uniref:Protein CcmA, bactofilin family n=1 Tax=Pustulibacterium marinum TaxID=1224947 RepID=A0A1I7ETX0_9FLAO|nr:polymer-forming cytoskeletal protein [Pustulibacterium marinum]SFU27375.1 protein CcmA, bactofilin family [Pustulibacterium marinum]
MFNEKKTTRPENVGLSNRILANTKIKGEVISDTDFRIDGSLEGDVNTSGKLVIGKTGLIDGKAQCSNADIEGTFTGTLVVKGLLTLKSTAVLEGDVVAGKLAIDPGATFNATCSMKSGASIKALGNGKQETKKSAS